jgi:ADP-ribosyl-[dinitrogen reductase] hydrolase
MNARITETKINDLLDKSIGGIVGALVGDALGVSFEFKDSNHIPPREMIEMDPPQGFMKSHDKTPIGTYSDDGAQALCLLDSLLTQGRFNLKHFSKSLINWKTKGYMAVDNIVFDCGIQTTVGISRLIAGGHPSITGPNDEMNNGNGSLMRCIPLALYMQNASDIELMTAAHEQSLPTHGHELSQACCALYTLWARDELLSIKDAFWNASDTLNELYWHDPHRQRALEKILSHKSVTGSGYCVDTLMSSLWALQEKDYESCVRAAISLGDDTDTTATVTGGIAGIRFGMSSIPKRWLLKMKGKETYLPVVKALREHVKKNFCA